MASVKKEYFFQVCNTLVQACLLIIMTSVYTHVVPVSVLRRVTVYFYSVVKIVVICDL